MKKDIKEILNYDIIENVGIGDIRFGMSEKEFFGLFDIPKAINEKITQGLKESGYWFFNDSIQIYFNSLKKLSYISLRNNFQGKLNGKIGIGSYIGELRALRKDIFVYRGDEGLCLGTGFRFIIEIDDDPFEKYITPNYNDFAKGSLDEFKITSISIGPWSRSDPDHRQWWCHYLDEWIEPEEKYLEIRYI